MDGQCLTKNMPVNTFRYATLAIVSATH